MTHNVLIVVTDELGTRTTISTHEMGLEHPLGDHVLSAIHRLQHGYGREVDRCVKRINDAVETARGLHDKLLAAMNPTETLRTVLDQPSADPGIGTIDFGDDSLYGTPGDKPCEPIDETITKLTADEPMKEWDGEDMSHMPKPALVQDTADEFDGSQDHRHDVEGFCVDEAGEYLTHEDDGVQKYWHHDDHDGIEPVYGPVHDDGVLVVDPTPAEHVDEVIGSLTRHEDDETIG
jgi:hypothetical protein